MNPWERKAGIGTPLGAAEGLTGIWKNCTPDGGWVKEAAPGMVVRDIGCSGFSTGCGSGRGSSTPPSPSPDRVLLAGGRGPS